jgi:hypothetical protein
MKPLLQTNQSTPLRNLPVAPRPPPLSSSPTNPSDADRTDTPLVEVRYSLPDLLRDVKRDRGSLAYAMEKLDQAAINTLFEQQQARRGPGHRS